MNNRAIEELRKYSITNWHPSHKENDGYITIVPFFEKQPGGNCLYQHIQIYKLIQEYVELFEDCQKIHSGARQLLENSMHEIERKLVNEFWIVSKNQKDPDKWTCCGFDH